MKKSVHFSFRHVGQTLWRYTRNLWITINFPVKEFLILVFIVFIHVSEASSWVKEVKLLVGLISLVFYIGLLWLEDFFILRCFKGWWLFYTLDFLRRLVVIFRFKMSLLIRLTIFVFWVRLMSGYSFLLFPSDHSSNAGSNFICHFFIFLSSILFTFVILEMWYNLQILNRICHLFCKTLSLWLFIWKIWIVRIIVGTIGVHWKWSVGSYNWEVSLEGTSH